MRLPGDSIGISDMLDWRECPTRMAMGMLRHDKLPDGRSAEVPGHTDWKNAYGSAIHDAIHLVETSGTSNGDAVTQVWPTYGRYLDPDDLALLEEDLDKYRGDTPLGYELVGSEMELRVPLFMHEGRQIFFRFRIDALYRRRDDHTSFYMRDYKSSKWPKSQAEVDKDPQMWAYNFGLHYEFPEMRSLLQSYEQLRYGNNLTSKNNEQRERCRRWLVETARAVLEDDEMAPSQNEWCPYCPLVTTCDETLRAHRVAKAKLAVLAPLSKEGRKTRIKFADEGAELEEMIERELPKLQATRKHIEAAEGAMKEEIERMPSAERERLGWRLAERKTKYLSPAGLQRLHEALGPSFYEAVSMPRSALETVAGKAELALADELELERVAPAGIRQAGGK